MALITLIEISVLLPPPEEFDLAFIRLSGKEDNVQTFTLWVWQPCQL